MYFYYDQNGQIAFYSKSPQGTTKLNEFVYKPTQDEIEKMKQNYQMTIQDGKLNFIEPDYLIVEKKKKEFKDMHDDLKDKIKNKTVTMDDLCNFILKL